MVLQATTISSQHLIKISAVQSHVCLAPRRTCVSITHMLTMLRALSPSLLLSENDNHFPLTLSRKRAILNRFQSLSYATQDKQHPPMLQEHSHISVPCIARKEPPNTCTAPFCAVLQSYCLPSSCAQGWGCTHPLIVRISQATYSWVEGRHVVPWGESWKLIPLIANCSRSSSARA